MAFTKVSFTKVEAWLYIAHKIAGPIVPVSLGVRSAAPGPVAIAIDASVVYLAEEEVAGLVAIDASGLQNYAGGIYNG